MSDFSHDSRKPFDLREETELNKTKVSVFSTTKH